MSAPLFMRLPSPFGVTVFIFFPSLCSERRVGRPAGARPASRCQDAVLSLQDLGVTKVGHMKRILCGIKELSRSTPATEA